MLRRTAASAFFLIEGFLDRIVCVVGAITASQAPEFFQQYLQRLGGHLDEATITYGLYEVAADATGQSVETLSENLQKLGDPSLSQIGQTIASTGERLASLQGAHEALANASAWERPFVFLAHIDLEIASRTAAVFKPAVPVTLEGALYAAAGLSAAFAIWFLVVRLPIRRWSDLGERPKLNPPLQRGGYKR